MSVHPPAAEGKLHKEEQYSHQATGGDAQPVVQSQSPVIEDEGTYHALSDVVGETHFAIRGYLHQKTV